MQILIGLLIIIFAAFIIWYMLRYDKKEDELNARTRYAKTEELEDELGWPLL